MVDMFTIILVFLLKSYSTSAVNITPQDGLKLPTSTSIQDPVEGLKLVVSQKGVYVDDTQVVEFDEKGQPKATDVDAADNQFIRPLYEALNLQAEKSRDIASVNESHKFEGKVIVQADQSLPYALIKKIMYTSMLAGFADVKLAVIGLE
jgi:biopolymer transport protein ExbD